MYTHRTVLLDEAVDGLITDPDGLYLDGTFGRGGHSRLILSRLGPKGRLIAFDKDPEAIREAGTITDPRFAIEHRSFAEMRDAMAERGEPHVTGVLMDLGISSPQIDNPERGFSFRFDGPLDMRMDPSRGESAAEFVARATVSEMAQVIRDYGEERFALPIAKAIAARRESGEPILTTGALSKIVAGAVKSREVGQDPATRTFQALRIHVNAELSDLEDGLSQALGLLAPAARLVVISFHSLEDRIVKTFIQKESKAEYDRRAPFAAPKPLKLKALARMKPSEGEVQDNPRSRSAVMRIAERTTEGF